jgi:hypothetical protein
MGVHHPEGSQAVGKTRRQGNQREEQIHQGIQEEELLTKLDI